MQTASSASEPSAEPHDQTGFSDAWASFTAEAAPPKRSWRLFAFVTALLFALSLRGTLGARGIAVLVAVVFLHELGHFVAMRLTGYRDVRIFFVPFLGAATTGRNVDATPVQEAFTLLAGPVPGIVLGAALLVPALGMHTYGLFEVATMLIVVNGFNLLPFGPLDGGKLVALGLFRRWPKAERWFTVAGSVVLAGIGLLMSAWVLVGFCLLSAVLQARAARTGDVIADLATRDVDWRVEPQALPIDARHTLFEAARGLTTASMRDKMPPSHHALYMRTLHGALRRPLPSVGASVAIVGAWAVACAVSIGGPFVAIVAGTAVSMAVHAPGETPSFLMPVDEAP